MDGDLPQVTVGILTRNGLARLRACLPSVLRLDYPNLDIVVADGGSTDGSLDFIRQLGRARIVALEGDFHVGRGRNRLMREAVRAGSAYFFMVDNDIEIPDPGLVDRLRRIYEEEQRLAFLSPLVVDAGSDVVNEVGLSHARVQRPQPIERVRGHGRVEASGYYGNCVFFRVGLLEETGEYDERYPFHNNDYDLGARAHLLGYRVLIDTDHPVIHHGKSARVDLEPVAWRYQYYLSSMARIVCKNYRLGNVLLWWPLTTGWILAKSLRLSWINRSPRPFLSCCKSFLYFLRDLPDTLRERRRVQAQRRVPTDTFLRIRPAVF